MSLFQVGLNLFRTFFSRKPFQVGYFYSAKFKLRINEVIEQKKPDAVFCQLTRMAEYVKDVKHIPKTLDYMDAFSVGLERLSKRSSFIKRIFVSMECRRLKRYEQNIFTYFEHHTIISEQDKKLIPHPQHDTIEVLPNGVDFDYYQPQQRGKKYDLIFSANMNYPPNIESALFIAKKVMPLLWKTHPDASLVIAGATPDYEIQKLKAEHIYITGWVDDMREYMAESRILLAPMFISIGMQNKILQAMAMKIPCIISSLSNNAIHAPVNECVLIANTAEEYAEKIAFLLSNPDKAASMAEKAYAFVKTNFNWREMVGQLEKILL